MEVEEEETKIRKFSQEDMSKDGLKELRKKKRILRKKQKDTSNINIIELIQDNEKVIPVQVRRQICIILFRKIMIEAI